MKTICSKIKVFAVLITVACVFIQRPGLCTVIFLGDSFYILPKQQDGPVLFVGHSQVNHQMPSFFKWLLEASNDGREVERQVIGGGNLEENFVLHAQTTDIQDILLDPDGKYLYFPGRFSTKGADARAELAKGTYSHLVITEEHGLTQAQARDAGFKAKHGVTFPPAEDVNPSGDTYLLGLYQPTHGIASGLGFYHDAVTFNRHASVYMYETWFPIVNGQTHCIRLSGDLPTKTLSEINSWRKRIYSYIPAWIGLAEEISQRRSQTVPGFSYGTTVIPDTKIAHGSKVKVIPVGQALSVLVERICAGQVGDLFNPNELFLDNAHMSEIGDYFVALVMYAALLNRSPEGISLTGSFQGFDGYFHAAPPFTVASAMQKIAWDVVKGNLIANNNDIATCTGLNTTSLPEPQLCFDPDDDETIPAYP